MTSCIITCPPTKQFRNIAESDIGIVKDTTSNETASRTKCEL